MATSTTEFQSDGERDKNGCVLGIDIGTTTVKTAIVNYNSRKTVARQNIEHCAHIVPEKPESFERHEQLVDKILLAINKCIQLLPDEIVQDVKDIVVCGQMHGCVLWEKGKLSLLQALNMEEKLQQIGNFASTLITWEDGRCSPKFLSSLPKGSQMSPLASGFGCASLFWLQRHSPEVLRHYDCAGTVMDLVVACLCSNAVVYMSTQNAYSWGYFDVENEKWELEKLTSENFPTNILPEVCKAGHNAGRLSQSWYGVPSGATVRVALGDMQCSILATMPEPGNAVLNIGTSIQLSIIVNETMNDIIFQEVLANPALNLVPYFDNCCLVVAAALTGGNALTFFVKMLQSWISDLGLEELSSEVIYKKLSECSGRQDDCAKLTIIPVLWGERHNPNQTASVADISHGSLSLGNVYRCLCHGLLVNILSMMSTDFLGTCGVQKIIGTGNALVRNAALQQSVEDLFNLQFVLCKNADASVGAALSTINRPNANTV